jgi:hypothetical protein
MLYKFSLQNRPKFSKVCHFHYNSFSGTNKGEKTWRNFREDIEEYWVQVSDLDSL